MTGVTVVCDGISNWGMVNLEYHNKDYEFPYYAPSGEVFNHDPSYLIRFKCLCLTAGTPVVCVARSIYWLSNSLFLLLSEAFYYLDGQEISEEDHLAMHQYAYDSLRALGYGILMTGSAIEGMIFPYDARLRYGELERSLNRHTDGPHRDKFYLAICFQRLIVLSDDHENIEEVGEKLTKYLARIDALRAALFSFSLQQLMAALHHKPAPSQDQDVVS